MYVDEETISELIELYNEVYPRYKIEVIDKGWGVIYVGKGWDPYKDEAQQFIQDVASKNRIDIVKLEFIMRISNATFYEDEENAELYISVDSEEQIRLYTDDIMMTTKESLIDYIIKTLEEYDSKMTKEIMSDLKEIAEYIDMHYSFASDFEAELIEALEQKDIEKAKEIAKECDEI